MLGSKKPEPRAVHRSDATQAQIAARHRHWLADLFPARPEKEKPASEAATETRGASGLTSRIQSLTQQRAETAGNPPGEAVRSRAPQTDARVEAQIVQTRPEMTTEPVPHASSPAPATVSAGQSAVAAEELETRVATAHASASTNEGAALAAVVQTPSRASEGEERPFPVANASASRRAAEFRDWLAEALPQPSVDKTIPSTLGPSDATAGSPPQANVSTRIAASEQPARADVAPVARTASAAPNPRQEPIALDGVEARSLPERGFLGSEQEQTPPVSSQQSLNAVPSHRVETTEKPMSRVDEINRVLVKLSNESLGLEASALISEDGLMIASALSASMEESRVAGMTATLLSLGSRASSELKRGIVQEVIVRGDHGYAVLISAGRGTLLLALANENSKLGLIFFDMREAVVGLQKVL